MRFFCWRHLLETDLPPLLRISYLTMNVILVDKPLGRDKRLVPLGYIFKNCTHSIAQALSAEHLWSLDLGLHNTSSIHLQPPGSRGSRVLYRSRDLLFSGQWSLAVIGTDTSGRHCAPWWPGSYPLIASVLSLVLPRSPDLHCVPHTWITSKVWNVIDIVIFQVISEIWPSAVGEFWWSDPGQNPTQN